MQLQNFNEIGPVETPFPNCLYINSLMSVRPIFRLFQGHFFPESTTETVGDRNIFLEPENAVWSPDGRILAQ